MAKESPAKTRVAVPPVRARAPAGRPARDDLEPHAAKPARNIPSELAVLLGEVQRLQAELAAARAKVTELEATADIDAVTGIFNRRGFERELRRSLSYVKRYGSRAALFYIDLDGFKPVNDRHGHAAGDAVLKGVATVLVGAVRASDTVARLGGDEFGLILWNLSEGDAGAKAWALEAAISDAGFEWLDPGGGHLSYSKPASLPPSAQSSISPASTAATDIKSVARRLAIIRGPPLATLVT